MQNTPLFGLPYPEAGDAIQDYPAVGQSLALTLEDILDRPRIARDFVGGQSVPSVSETVVSLQAPGYEVEFGHTGNGLDVQEAGLYLVSLWVSWDYTFTGASVGRRILYFVRSNAANVVTEKIQHNAPAIQDTGTVTSKLTKLLAGEHLGVNIYQDSGSPQALLGGQIAAVKVA